MTEDRYDLLVDHILRFSGAARAPGQGREPLRLTLPGWLAAWSRGEALEAAGAQAHQLPPLYVFAVQLAAMALEREDGAQLAPPETESTWRELLLALTSDEGSAWRLCVPDLGRPAFMQPPVPEGSLRKWLGPFAGPDEIDLLVTAKNHDVKRERVSAAEPDAWVWALITAQTFQGFSGRGNYGIARMNGGFGNRPILSFAPSLAWSARFLRDLEVLREARQEIAEKHEFAERGGRRLLWLEPWDGESSAQVSELHPYAIEICRRLRLVEADDRLALHRTSTKAPAVRAGELNGLLGDPWTPTGEGPKGYAAVTIPGGGFSYSKVHQLLFDSDPGAAMRVREEDRLFVAFAFVRGQGVTEGMHRRVLPIPLGIRRCFASADERKRMCDASAEQIADANTVQQKLLKMALLSYLQGGERDLKLKDDRPRPFLEAFDHQVDAAF
ncbi:MAG: type I-E CRISPR-associated protein Cse1/CasA, partial [Myxococcales bacterium]|nr:type I-E CRISPR-associated protein Cse1/CasA [Myxococcales bacterium]